MTKHCYIKTFGCQMNERDSEIIEQLLAQNGYVSVAEMDDADLVVLNTCSIRAKAEQKVYSLLGQLRPNKERDPNMRIVVAGCVAQQEGEELIRKMPHVDVVVGTQQVYRIPELLESIELGETKRGLALELSTDFEIPPYQQFSATSPPAPSTAPQIKKFVTIMQGCNNYCSYCVVPATRGREISRPLKDIVEEVELLTAKGVKEITLLGQNVNSY
ncbi:MAG: radical SAM protein, partial [Desulfobulbaceae bacterium]|nr:radical SAM protein [Desulfobulbaceae bacterium]